jgi:hypothetical protein
MTRQQAIQKLKSTRQLSTGMLAPLGISFESFLQFAQLPDAKCKELVEKLIVKLEDPK